MSLRPSVGRERIELFLRVLGQAVRQPARLYLVGGTTIVYEGLRATTLDIDYVIEIAPEHLADFEQAMLRIKHRLQINVEPASPGDFIPLPQGWRERCPFVGHYGTIQVFHFDLLSVALSKLGRGTEEDLEDVRALIEAGYITLAEIEDAWTDIRTQRTGWLRTDPDDIAANLVEIHARLGLSA